VDRVGPTLSSAVVQRCLFDEEYDIHKCSTCYALYEAVFIQDEGFLPDFTASRLYQEGLTNESAATLQTKAKFTIMDDLGEVYFRGSGLGRRDFGVLSPQRKAANRVRSVNSRPDYTAINAWLTHCSEKHGECAIPWSEPLTSNPLASISLIDVEARRVIPYPIDSNPTCRYFALSYTWGGVAPAAVRKSELLPENLPHTIADSISFTRNLGIKYLWVDALCIDQSNSDEMEAQISIMDSIYRGAFATIVSLHGTSAESGLPGVGDHSKRTPQIFVEFGPNTVAELFPTLNQAIGDSRWSERGWTYQEGTLSNRRILVSQHQVYFHCNSMTCYESVDSENSFGSSILHRDRKTNPALNNLIVALSATDNEETQSRKIFYKVVNGYIERKLSSDVDALNAVSGLLRYLQIKLYPKGFFYGLPLLDFRRSLLWCHGWGSTSRDTDYHLTGLLEPVPQRDDSMFPSWSWVGWKTVPSGEVGEPHWNIPKGEAAETENDIKVPLFVSTRDGKLLVSQECASEVSTETRAADERERLVSLVNNLFRELLAHNPHTLPRPPLTHSPEYPRSTFQVWNHSLWITGLILRIRCKRSPPPPFEPEKTAHYNSIKRKKARPSLFCLDHYYTNALSAVWYLDAGADVFTSTAKTHKFWMLDMNLSYIWLLHLEWENENGTAKRLGVVELKLTDEPTGRFFQLCGPKIASFWLS
jgi:hypothetical protein